MAGRPAPLQSAVDGPPAQSGGPTACTNPLTGRSRLVHRRCENSAIHTTQGDLTGRTEGGGLSPRAGIAGQHCVHGRCPGRAGGGTSAHGQAGEGERRGLADAEAGGKQQLEDEALAKARTTRSPSSGVRAIGSRSLAIKGRRW
jgi:hypothetical protein